MLPDDDTRCINIIITNCLMEEEPVSLSVLRNATGIASSPLKHGWFWAEAKATPSLLSQTPAARTKQFRILFKKTQLTGLCCMFCIFKLLTELFRCVASVPCR